MMRRVLFLLVFLSLVALPGPAFTAGPLQGKTICLDPGHGGSDPGAVYDDGPIYLEEADINLDVAQALQGLLAGDGAAVFMTRTGDQSKSNSDRYTFCNALPADILISVHTNSTTNSTSDGSLALYFHGDDQVLAQAVYDVIYPDLAATAPVGVTFTGFGLERFAAGLLLKSNMPATIVEPLFMSNAAEAVQLATPIGAGCLDCRRAQIAQAIHDGVVEYFSSPGGGEITLTATAHKVKGLRTVDLVWTGAEGAEVKVLRNGEPIAQTADASYTDTIVGRGSGTFSYQVCRTDGQACSNIATVTF